MPSRDAEALKHAISLEIATRLIDRRSSCYVYKCTRPRD